MGLFGKIDKGLVFVVSAPSGTGKTTLVQMLLQKYPQQLARSVSCTTRPPRKGEQPGIDYIFLQEEEFASKIKEGAFLEYAKVFNHHYGTFKKTVEDLQSQGKHVFLVIDVQGALLLKGKIKAFFVFIAPPSLEALRKRLEGRGSDSAQEIAIRLSKAKEELDKAKEYDVTLINEDLHKAYKELEAFVGQTEKKLCTYIN